MRLSSLRPGFALATLVLVLPFAGEGGCTNNTACFTFSQSELAANGNSCPAQQDALPNFSDPNCPGPVVTVNGPGQYDGELCCYPVTFQAITPDCSTGGSGGGSVVSPAVTGPPPPGPGPGAQVASAGAGVGGGGTGGGGGAGGGGPGGCSPTCEVAIETSIAPCAQPALGAFEALLSCAGCAGEGPDASGCFSVCEGICVGEGIDVACSTCLGTECVSPLSVCTSE